MHRRGALLAFLETEVKSLVWEFKMLYKHRPFVLQLNCYHTYCSYGLNDSKVQDSFTITLKCFLLMVRQITLASGCTVVNIFTTL